MKFEHALPSTSIRHLVVTRDMVDDPGGALNEILTHPGDLEREAAFQRLLSDEEKRLKKLIAQKIPDWRQHYGTHFSDERVNLIVKHTLEQQTDAEVAVAELQAIQRAVEDFAKEFSARNALDISFTDGAVYALAEKLWKESQDPSGYLKRLLQNYDHGLKLIKEKTGNRQFSIPAEGIENPEQFLNRLIQDVFRCE
jgi:ATP-dependent Clp protease ATP-binding subunit ClpX